METFLNSIIEFCTDSGIKIVLTIVLLIIGLKLAKWFVRFLEKHNSFVKLDEGLRRFMLNTIKIALYGLILVSAAIAIGIPSASFITVLGSAGVAIGLALQGSLSNVASGILILVNKPFRIGDFVECSGVSGVVDDIGFFSTTLKTVDNKTVVCPNSSITGGTIINYSSMPTRRLDLTFSVAYNSDVNLVKSVLENIINKNDMILKDPAPFVSLLKYGESSLDFVVRVWVNSADYWTVNFYMLDNVKAEFDKNNIRIPYQTIDVNINQ